MTKNKYLLYEDVIALGVILVIITICIILYFKIHNMELVLGILGLGLILVGTFRQVFFAFKKGSDVTNGHSVIFLVCMCLSNLLRLLSSRDAINKMIRSTLVSDKIVALIGTSTMLVSLFYLIMIWCVGYFNKKDNKDDISNKELANSIKYYVLILYILIVIYLLHWSY